MQKNRNNFVCFLTLALWLVSFLLPEFAFAVTIPTTAPITVDADGTVCPTASKGLIVKIVPCIRDTILYATSKMFGQIAEIIAKTVTVACTLAVVLWGIRMMLGQAHRITAEGMMLAMKIGAISLFTSQYKVLFPKMLNVMEDMINIVAQPGIKFIWMATSCKQTFTGSDAKIMEVFGAVDCYLDGLIGGIFNNVDVKNGIIGFLFSLMSSNPAGFFMGGIGLVLVGLSLLTIAKSLFIFMQAFIAFALMSIISPIFVPLSLFKSTEKYFKQWANITISFIVQPVILMGYLTMFLMAFDATVFHGKHSLYHAIAGVAADDKTGNFKIGQWLNNNGVYVEKSLNDKGNNVDPKGAKASTGDPAALDKGVESKIGQNPDCEGSTTTNCIKMNTAKELINSQGYGNVVEGANKALNYFKTDTPVQTLNWAKLASIVDASGCSAVNCTSDTATGAAKDKIDKYLTGYKIKVFLTFIMALVMIYVFYSLLDYLPIISSGLISEVGRGVVLGQSKSSSSSATGGGK